MARKKSPREELVDIYDDSMAKVGVASRPTAHATGAWHLDFHCWIIQSDTRSMLFQIRSMNKDSYPGKLDSTVGSHFKAGEATRDVIREFREEVGVKVDPDDLVPLGRRIDIGLFRRDLKREIACVFFLPLDLPLDDYRLDTREVSGLVAISIASGLRLFSRGAETIAAKGLGLSKDGKVEAEALRVEQADFVPKVDSYYLTLFITAKRFLNKERPLSI